MAALSGQAETWDFGQLRGTDGFESGKFSEFDRHISKIQESPVWHKRHFYQYLYW